MNLVEIEVNCSKCGEGYLCHSDPKPNDLLTCVGCGAQGSYKEIMSEAKKKAVVDIQKELEQIARETLGSSDFIIKT